jgi:hypothetical protein
MAIISGYGGAFQLTLQGGTIATFPARNITVSVARSSLDVTTIADFREKRAPGRFSRTATFDLMAQNGSDDNAIRSHMNPTTLALAVAVTCTLTYTDQGSVAYTMIGHMTSATRTDDGTGPGMWSITLEEF